MSITYVFVDLEQVSQPRSGLMTVYVDYYWEYVEGRGLVFARVGKGARHAFPQCNSDEGITRRLMVNNGPENVVVKKVPIAFLPTNHDGVFYLPTKWITGTEQE
jgi:hypothetical protein